MSATTARQIVLDAVEGAGYPAPFRELVLLALSQPGRILNSEHSPRFQDIISACCKAAHGRIDLLPRVAAAVELCIAASDVLDEIEDGDDSEVASRGGVPRALNTTTSLLALCYSTLSAPGDSPADAALLLSLSHTLSDTIVASTIGQDQDLSDAYASEDPTQRALDIARIKSGSLVAGACVLGATLASTDPELWVLYHDFGLHLGTAYQLSNDLRDAESARKSDMAQEKATVPLVFMRANSAPKSSTAEVSPRQSGALHFTWALMETERIRCDHIMDKLESRGQDVSALKPLLGDR